MRHYKHWIALEQTKGIGPAQLREIYEALSRLKLSITDLFELDAREIEEELSLSESKAGLIAGARDALAVIERDYLDMLDAGVEIIPFFDESYPARLSTLLGNTGPPFLYCMGNRRLLPDKGAAILGDKFVSEKGEMITYLAAQELVRHRIAVISGFARGADMIAHRAAIESRGGTIALLPHGFAHLQVPQSFQDVFNLDSLLLVSPFSFKKEYSPYNAMQRNRIICALSHAVYIVESPVEGGIFEAGKSAQSLGIPLYTTEYSSYPETAAGNPKLLSELGANPVRGRIINNVLTPNLDRLIGDVKFPAA